MSLSARISPTHGGQGKTPAVYRETGREAPSTCVEALPVLAIFALRILVCFRYATRTRASSTEYFDATMRCPSPVSL
jgi:hypothetical protein